MAYALVYSPCIGCDQVFGYNPHRVPSLFVKGNREPICRECVERVNPGRKKKGYAPIVPHADAYEPIEEHQL